MSYTAENILPVTNLLDEIIVVLPSCFVRVPDTSTAVNDHSYVRNALSCHEKYKVINNRIQTNGSHPIQLHKLFIFLVTNAGVMLQLD